MPSRPSRKAGHIGSTQSPRPVTTCKTCSLCRQKKIKCSGSRPRCDTCLENDQECVYLRDARKEPRPSRARLMDLEATMAAMLEQIREAGMTSNLPTSTSGGDILDEHDQSLGMGSEDAGMPHLNEPAHHLPTPTASTTTQTHAPRFGDSPASLDSLQPTAFQIQQSTSPNTNNNTNINASHPNSNSLRSSQTVPPARCPPEADNGLSPCEARVAGVYHEHGCVSSVHGLAGIMNHTRRAFHKENISKVSRKGEVAIDGSKARLVSNAILQKQREGRIFRQPQQLIDLDGCEPELARHLIDMHFNRHHYSCMVTYRPAILDSIANGGPWVNKLLLNAIYHGSSLYSDRKDLSIASSNDPENIGGRFYSRFSQLLVEAIGKPSIPSAAALLLVSSTLIAQGHVSAAWTLAGTAYRMAIDLGCHMMLGPDYETVTSQSSHQMLQKDIEQEVRKRLYWGAVTTDVTQSLYLGRQCSFATTEARVPLLLLDTFEELEEWVPYIDPQEIPAPASGPYIPQPAYAVSGLMSLVKLMQIGAQVTKLYGIDTVEHTTEAVLKEKQEIESRLDHWLKTLPEHLVFDPDGQNPVPPPHQIIPHTTFHTFRILLYRAFLEEGHLRRHSDASAKRLSEQECIASALAIERHIQAYRRTFTLRRAPLLISYAIYSAVAVILPQERHDRGHFTRIIAFFWKCLGELQRGCNFGLQKPLSVLRDMAREFQLSSREQGATSAPGGSAAVEQQQQSPPFASGTLDESFFPRLPLAAHGPNLEQDIYSSGHYHGDTALQTFGDPYNEAALDAPGMMNFLNDQEWNISQNTLYGLFAPGQY